MATLYITEIATQGQDGNTKQIILPQFPPLAEQTVAIAAGSAQSAALNASTTMVRLHTDAVCSVAIGANPTATAANMRMAANTSEWVSIPRGSSPKIAVITNT